MTCKSTLRPRLHCLFRPSCDPKSVSRVRSCRKKRLQSPFLFEHCTTPSRLSSNLWWLNDLITESTSFIRSMIIRASRPRLPLDASRLQPAFEQLNLPWLCPALCGLQARPRLRSTTTISTRSPTVSYTLPHPKIRKSPQVQKPTPGRGYAFAAVADYANNNDEYIPFDQVGLSHPPPSSSGYPWASSRGLTDLPTFDPTSPLVIHDSLRPAPRKFRDHSSDGTGGEIHEIHQTLDACLQVGRLERAAATLRRLSLIYRLDAPELIKTHNGYLASLIDRVVNTKDQELLKQVQRWFEVEIRAQGIPPDALTYGLMLRASFQEANQLKIDRTIRRYIALAEQAGLRDEALSTALTTLNAQEIGRVTRVCTPLTVYLREQSSSSQHR